MAKQDSQGTYTQAKYLMVGGYVKSTNDGDTHYIPAKDLVKLYGLNPLECLLTTRDEDAKYKGYTRFNSMIVLRPHDDGDYSKLPDGLPTIQE